MKKNYEWMDHEEMIDEEKARVDGEGKGGLLS